MDGFSCKLKEWRLASGLSQQQIADLLNYGLSTVQSWEAGRKLPSYDALISLADMMMRAMRKMKMIAAQVQMTATLTIA